MLMAVAHGAAQQAHAPLQRSLRGGTALGRLAGGTEVAWRVGSWHPHWRARPVPRCRPLSKTVRFNVLRVIPAGSGNKKGFTGF
jgi:hypothetical protein